MYDTHVLTDVGARSVWEHGKKVGYQIKLRIPYYRGLPLSCIDVIELWVDGEKVDPETMYVTSQGKTYKYLDIFRDDMETETYWLFGDFLTVTIKKDGGIEQGHHEVRANLGVRCSYSPTRMADYERIITFG